MIPKINHLNLELTKRCNLKCGYCFNNSGEPMKYELSFQDWEDILKTGKNYGAKSILVTGGEFMMRDDSIDILNFAFDKGFRTSILSNGYKLNSLDKNILNKLQKAQISVDSYFPLNHDVNRGKGSWKTAVNAIHYLRENDVPVEISATLSNVNGLEGLLKLARENDSKLLLRSLQPIGRSKNGFYFDFKQDDLIVSDIEGYVPLEKDHDKNNLEKGIVTVLPNGFARGSNLNFSEFLKKNVA